MTKEYYEIYKETGADHIGEFMTEFREFAERKPEFKELYQDCAALIHFGACENYWDLDIETLVEKLEPHGFKSCAR